MTNTIDNDYDFESANYLPHITKYEGFNFNDITMMHQIMKLDLHNRAPESQPLGPHHTVYILDTAIRVQVISDTHRASMIRHWEAKRNTSKTWSLLTGGVTALLALGALLTPAWAAALGVAAVGALILTAAGVIRMNEASYQIAGWGESPLQKVADERAKAYAQGFPYALRNDLKLLDPKGSSHAVLLPSEVHFLYERYFDAFCQKLLNEGIPYTEQDKKTWLDQFTSCNPVSSVALAYAHNGLMQIPQKYSRVSHDYEVLHGQLTDIRRQFATLRQQREDETQSIIREINANRELALLPFHTTLIHYLEGARSERDLSLISATTPAEKRAVLDKYDADVARYRSYHLLAITPVHLYYDSQVSSAKEQLRHILEEIKRNEATSHAPFFNYARSLLDYAWRTKNEPSYTYQPQVFNPAIFQVPTPSAPPMEAINFMDLALHQNVPQGQYTEYVRFVQWNSSQPPQQIAT